MRLICPNCDAEYEVDDSAIPQAGRDVQCSNCGHAWFQAHPEALPEAAPLAAAQNIPVAVTPPVMAADGQADDVVEPDDVPTDLAADAVARVTPVADDLAATATDAGADAAPEMAAALSAADDHVADAVLPPVFAVEATAETAVRGPAAAKRNIDDSVLAVLREEAEREAAVRRAEVQAPALETQTEMRLEPEAEAAAIRRVQRLKGEDPARAAHDPARPRRELLPAIEEINSTLRASSGRSPEENEQMAASAEAATPASSGFRSGFLTLVGLAVIVMVLYVLAPMIAARVPALAGAATGYVTAVDAARIWLDMEIRSLIGLLRGINGTSQG